MKKFDYKAVLYGLILIILVESILVYENILKDAAVSKKRMEKEMEEEILFFPVARNIKDSTWKLSYENTFGASRTYGGNRVHEGCDIFSTPGEYGTCPIVSVCDGTVENIGWLKLGGYRMGIRSHEGYYYYYAHLSDYDREFQIGDHIKAGQILGYMGSTGYSNVPGTYGKFQVHLHFGIYYNYGHKLQALNPYFILKKKEKCLYDYKGIRFP